MEPPANPRNYKQNLVTEIGAPIFRWRRRHRWKPLHAGECFFFQQPSLKTLHFPCFWPPEPLKWVVDVVGSDVDVNARRPTCRLYWFLLFTAHPALEVPFASVWPMFRACMSCCCCCYCCCCFCCWLRRWRKHAKIDMPSVLFFTAHPALEVSFASVWLGGGGWLPGNQERGGGDPGLAGISRNYAVWRAIGGHY